MSVLLAGGGFQRGYVHGATDEQGGEPIAGACTPANLAATILHRLGIPLASKVTSPNGRERSVMPQGNVIPHLFS